MNALVDRQLLPQRDGSFTRLLALHRRGGNRVVCGWLRHPIKSLSVVVAALFFVMTLTSAAAAEAATAAKKRSGPPIPTVRTNNLAPLAAGVKAGAIVQWLKDDFQLGHGHAMAIFALLKGVKREANRV